MYGTNHMKIKRNVKKMKYKQKKIEISKNNYG